MWPASSTDRSLLEPRPTAPAPARDVADFLPIESAAKPSITILVVDDDRTLRDSCASVLGVEGYRVTAVGHGDEALRLVKRHAFDIVLVDWYMREVSGIELLGAILAARPQTIAITMTGRPSSRPSVGENGAAPPEPLLESEMFGNCKGGFTGAVREKPGLLETANGGTLFLDELIEMSKPIQAKLLRVIQDGVVRRVGSETTDAIVNVRFIAATNQIPEDAVKATALREDLYYRLRVLPIHVPALRERPDGIPLLANHFLAYYWHRHRSGMPALPKLTPAALEALRAHSWPGNVRELQNVIEHAVVLLEPSADVLPDDIPFITSNGQRATPPPAPGALIGSPAGATHYASRDRMLAEFDRQYLIRLVQLAGGNMSKAARLAGIDRATLYRLIERHGMQRDAEGLTLTEDA